MQTFSEISDNYPDIYKKIEDILLSRYEQLELYEASVIACGYAVSGFGSDLLFEYLEKIIMSKFNELDEFGFREIVRAYVVTMSGSKEFFELIKMRIKDNLELFNITEKLFIVKCYFDREQGDKELYEEIEKSIGEKLKRPKDILLEELCSIADCLCRTGVFSREFQKLFELTMSERIKDIVANPKVSRFLYNTFYNSGMCSVGMMNLLYKTFAG